MDTQNEQIQYMPPVTVNGCIQFGIWMITPYSLGSAFPETLDQMVKDADWMLLGDCVKIRISQSMFL